MSLRANETELKFRVSSFLPFRRILKEKWKILWQSFRKKLLF